MKKRKYILLYLIVLLIGIIFLYLTVLKHNPHSFPSAYSIKNEQQITEIELEKKSNTDYVLHARVYNKNKFVLTDSWHLGYAVFRIDTGDINNDKSTDIFVGVIKSTRFDPVSRKRLFVFKLFEGYIRPLWLGSRVSQPLVDFKFVKSESGGVVRTIESEADQSYLVAEYRWVGFGLGFIHYLARTITLDKAYKLLNTKPYESTGQGIINSNLVHRDMGLQTVAQ